MSKRLFDLVLVIIALPVFLPIMLMISVLIWLTDGNPIMFMQKRVGRFGRDFRIFKFRTMTSRPKDTEGSFDAGNASRVTKIGKLLRKTKLDELPQLFNVLRGDMSLVGPRPEVRKWVDACPERWEQVHQIRPGITDPASIEFRNEEEILSESSDPEKMYLDVILPRKLDLYEKYVEQRSLFLDVGIILKTILAILKMDRFGKKARPLQTSSNSNTALGR